MNMWRRVLRAVGLARGPQRRLFALDAELAASLQVLAEREQRPADEVACSLLAQALEDRQAAEAGLARWQALSLREQQVAALMCLGYTNQQIARRFELSPNTVKTHVSSILHKFGAADRGALRRALAAWDFEAWQGG